MDWMRWISYPVIAVSLVASMPEARAQEGELDGLGAIIVTVTVFEVAAIAGGSLVACPSP